MEQAGPSDYFVAYVAPVRVLWHSKSLNIFSDKMHFVLPVNQQQKLFVGICFVFEGVLERFVLN